MDTDTSATGAGTNDPAAATTPGETPEPSADPTPAAPPDDRPVAVITGGARGIGAATARVLVTAGWRVGLIDLPDGVTRGTYTRASTDDFASVLRGCDEIAGVGTALGVVADAARRAALDDAVGALVEQFGRLDAAVSCAGAIASGGPAWAEDDEVWDAMVMTNLVAVRNLAHATIPHLLAHPVPRSGRFVAVSSSAAKLGLQRLGAYSAAKAGVTGFIRALAADLEGTGVTATAVCPTSTRTAMLEASAAIYGLDSPEDFAAQEARGRLLEPTEVAAFLLQLVGPEGVEFHGAALDVPGD